MTKLLLTHLLNLSPLWDTTLSRELKMLKCISTHTLNVFLINLMLSAFSNPALDANRLFNILFYLSFSIYIHYVIWFLCTRIFPPSVIFIWKSS